MLSLQDICLKKIVNYFETYYSVYSAMTKDQQLKSNFEPLRRVYSPSIAMKLYKMGSLRADYVDFLINTYLKELDTRWLNNCSWDAIIKKMDEIGHVLEKVSFHKNEMPWEKEVCYLPNLKTLVFRNHCNDYFLYSVAAFCPLIETINISCSRRVTDEGIKYLCFNENGTVPCPMLKRVSVHATNVGDDGVKYLLKKVPSIKEIDYERICTVVYSLHDISYLDKVKTYLTRLDITSLNEDFENEDYLYILDDVLKICVTVCLRLKYLRCGVTKQEHLKLCSRLSQLESLDVEGLNETPVDINDFLKESGYKLKSLSIENVSMTVSILVENCPQLEFLDMTSITFLADNNDSVFVQHNLDTISFTRLIFASFETSRSVARLLAFYPNLKYINFWVCDMYSSEIKIQIIKCCEQCSLKFIRFDCCVVEPEILENILLKCSSLECLDVSNCSLDDMNLEERHSDEMRVILEKLESIASSLPNRPKIRHLFKN